MIDYTEPIYIYNLSDLQKNVKLGHTTESLYMDFKLEIDFNKTSTKKKDQAEELALDICQFANSWGGVILLGVKESKTNLDGKRVAEEYIGILDFEDFSRFLNDSVLPIIHPKSIKIEIANINITASIKIVAINVYPLAISVSCVCSLFSPYSTKYPYRTNYGKKYLHPIEVEERMSNNNRDIEIKLEELKQKTSCVSLFPDIMKMEMSKPGKWDHQNVNVIFIDKYRYEFCLKINGISINIPYSLVKDVWFTEMDTIGIILNCHLVISSDRKKIMLDL